MAINENTAAVAHVFASPAQGSLPLSQVVEIAHTRGVPVIVDAAAMLPPLENLTRYIAMGADLVSYSGGKGVRGPQSTGILCGRNDLIEAAYELTSNSGKIVCVGIPKKQFKAKIDTFQLHFAKEISGSHGGSSNPSYVIPRYINLFHKKKINIKKQILNKFSLDNINTAIKNFRLGSLGRIVIKF